MKISDKQKDNMPDTNLFIWFIPVFLVLAYICKNDIPLRSVDTHYYNNMDSNLTILGWRIL